MNKYITYSFITVVVLLLGLLKYTANQLTDTKASLAISEAVNDANQRSITHLSDSINNTDTVLTEWNTDRTTLNQIRNTTHQAIKEAMRDEAFKIWASAPAPAPAWRLLQQATDTDGNNQNNTTTNLDDGLPRNGNTKQGK